MTSQLDRHQAEARFRTVFAHLGADTAYARRRGSRDADAIAAEAMAIAWRRLADVPADDPRPWLYATARNLLRAEARRRACSGEHLLRPDEPLLPVEPLEFDPALGEAL